MYLIFEDVKYLISQRKLIFFYSLRNILRILVNIFVFNKFGNYRNDIEVYFQLCKNTKKVQLPTTQTKKESHTFTGL